jgi:hypothetical protein
LPERVDGHEACPGKGLEVLGGLWLAQAGELRQLADRPGSFGEELDDLPPGGVAERRGDAFHAS